MHSVGNKLVSIILSVVLAVGMVPSSALAKAADVSYLTDGEYYVGIAQVVSGNPLYDGSDPMVVSETVVPVDQASAASECLGSLQSQGIGLLSDTPQALFAATSHSDADAVAALRAGFASSQETIEVVVDVTGESFQDWNPVYNRAYALIKEAFEHTGNPYEGDYMRWRYSNWSMSATWNLSVATLTFTVGYYTTDAQETALKQRVSQVLDDLNLDTLCSYDKVVAIHDWIVRNVAYDYVNLNDSSYKLKYTAYAAAMNGTSVCQGFASLFMPCAFRRALTAA